MRFPAAPPTAGGPLSIAIKQDLSLQNNFHRLTFTPWLLQGRGVQANKITKIKDYNLMGGWQGL